MRYTARYWLVCTLLIMVADSTPAVAATSGFGGTVTYTGTHGPVSPARPICVCAFADPQLTQLVGCLEVDTSPGHYDAFTHNMNTYYLVVFVDFNLDVALEPGEPYQIYNNKGAPPGDPVVAASPETEVDITFGDDNIAPFPTASPSATPTPTPMPCVGDCSHDDHVTVDELITMVNIALGIAPPGDCSGGDVNDDQQITIDEILTAVGNALNGCSPAAPS